MKKVTVCLFVLLISACSLLSQSILPYKNPRLSAGERARDLLQRMTREEKFWQLFMIPGEINAGDGEKYENGIFGFQVSAASQGGGAAGQLLKYGTGEKALVLARKINAIQKYFIERTRLGIPIIAFDETLHGLVREDATSFPQSIALAATFDTSLMHRVATAIAGETKMRGIRQSLSPVINIATDVRWGRVEETYGEDPFLTSEMAVAYVSAFEKMGIITTPKHLIANVGDGGRDSYPIHFNERLLEEIHFPPFKACFERGGTRSVMTSYNSLDGTACSANDWMLNKKLKEEWKFDGFVISDASAVGGANVLHFTSPDYPTSGAQAINGGLDVIFQTSYDHYKLFIPPFLDGRIDSNRINDAVFRVLKAKFELGLFENPYVPEEAILKQQGDKSTKSLAKEAALKSIVLLKNNSTSGKDGTPVLPFSKNMKSIAIIGTDAVEARLGGYSGPGIAKVSILDGIRKRAGHKINVTYTPGCGRMNEEWKTIPSEYLSCIVNGKRENGLKGEYFNNVTLSGNPVLSRVDKGVDFHWTLFSPDPAINNDFYSVRWNGKLTVPVSGKFKIGIDGNDGFRLYLNNQLIIDKWEKQTYSTQLTDFIFEKGKQYDIRVEFFEPVGNAHIRLIWNLGVVNDVQKKIADAVEAAKQADIAIVVAGIQEGEFQDRAMLSLPGHQEELIQKIAATGKPVVVLLVGGSAITMSNWLDKVNAVLDIWYPGEEGGSAVSEVLFGDYNPAGKLPVTFPVSEAQLPLVYNHKPTGRGDDYNNLSGLPLFPFGFGLSYSNFEYADVELEKNKIQKNESTIVHFKIKNTGKQEGDEVVQLYIRDLLSSVARPVMELKGFQRTHLNPGETKDVSFAITPEMLRMLDKDLKPIVEPGDFRIMVGSSSRDIRLRTILTVID